MTDRIFLDLCDGWALGYDPNQWIVLRARKRQDQTYWNPEAFIGSTKRVLRRVLREKGVQPTPEADGYLDAMPESFLDWYRLHSTYRDAAE